MNIRIQIKNDIKLITKPFLEVLNSSSSLMDSPTFGFKKFSIMIVPIIDRINVEAIIMYIFDQALKT